MQLFLAELMVFGKTAGEEQLVPAGTKPGLFWDPVRGSSSSDPPAQGQVALAPTWPNPPVPQVTLAEQGDVGLTGQCSVAGGILSLHIPWAASCWTPTHVKGTQRCSWPPGPLVPALLWLRPLHWHRAVGSQPRELLQVENNSVFPEQSDTGSLCQAGSQCRASMPVLA